MSDLIRTIRKATSDLRNRILLMVARGVVRAISDDGGLQRMQVALLADELREGVERLQNYGLSSHPHPGATAGVAFVGGNRDHGLVMAVDDPRYRPQGLAEGEVQVYASFGQFMHLREDGVLHIKAPAGIILDTPGALEMWGGTVMRHAQDYDGVDVHGLGSKLHWRDGEWQEENWTTGAQMQTPIEHSVNPPAIPGETRAPDWVI